MLLHYYKYSFSPKEKEAQRLNFPYVQVLCSTGNIELFWVYGESNQPAPAKCGGTGKPAKLGQQMLSMWIYCVFYI